MPMSSQKQLHDKLAKQKSVKQGVTEDIHRRFNEHEREFKRNKSYGRMYYAKTLNMYVAENRIFVS